jgi:hypothetical protein
VYYLQVPPSFVREVGGFIMSPFSSIGSRWPGILLFVSLLLVSAPMAHSDQTCFSTPLALTSSASDSCLSRSTRGNLVFDGSTKFHLVYQEISAASPDSNDPAAPSLIYHLTGSRYSWSDPYLISSPNAGARHPCLALRDDRTVVIAWQDARHTTQAGNYQDNVEIYSDMRPPRGMFSPSDFRVTETEPPLHNGDNGFAPKVIIDSTGNFRVVWFDFHFDYSISDVFMKVSNTNGIFDPAESMASARLTTFASGRGAYFHPDLAEDGSGQFHLIWTEGFAIPSPVWSMTLDSNGAILAQEQVTTTGPNNLDPPHIVSSPGGDVYAAWSDRRDGNPEIYAARLLSGATAFSQIKRISLDPAVSYQPDIAVAADGTVHLVWSDNRDGVYDIYYRTYNFGSDQLGATGKLTFSEGTSRHSVIALAADGSPTIVYENNATGIYNLYSQFARVGSSVEQGWEMYR